MSTESKVQRVKPLTIRDVRRRWMMAYGTGDTALAAQEIVTTSDQRRLFRGDGTLLSGGVDHGSVATEAALATIYLLPSCTRGVWPNDTAFVAASGCEYRCISGSNATAVWRAVGGGSTIPSIAGLPEALDGKAALDGPAFTGAPTAPTPAAADNSTRLATTAFVTAAVAAAGGGGGGSSWAEVADADVPATEIEFPVAWSANGDANGLLYLLATDLGASEWTNPHNSGAVVVTRSSGWSGSTYQLVDRSTSGQEFFSANALGGWFAVDLLSAVVITDYSLKSDSETGYKPRNWTLQGSNNVESNTTAGIEAATWVDLDVRTNDSTIQTGASTWGHFVIPGTPAAYRWFRVILTGVESSGSYYLAVVEFELYCGTYTQLTARVRPSGSRCWLTDGEYYVPAW